MIVRSELSRAANFYALPFASQLIVWAVRKRLHALSGDTAAMDGVLQVFHLANWGELYGALLALADALAGGAARDKLQVHAVGCPCLAPHEARLLNALAYLQDACPDEAILCLVESFAPRGVRLMLPHLRWIAEALKTQDMRFVYIEITGPERPSGALSGARGIGHVH